MLRMHPTPAMEALCAFDGANANPMLSLLSCISEPVAGFVSGQAISVTQLSALALPAEVPIIIGTDSPHLASLGATVTVCPHVHRAAALPLFGFSLPFDDHSFEVTLVAGVWQLLPERLACRIFSEALRIARRVYLLKDTRVYEALPDWAEPAIATHDTPYWSRTCRVSRSFHDFALRPLCQVGPLASFEILAALRLEA